MINNICAGIVLYNSDIDRLKQNIDSICGQVYTVYLQDNGSDNIGEVENLLNNYSNVVLLKNDTNRGIAWALNRLCERAENESFKWILTLDQDSVCPVGMIDKYVKHLSDNVKDASMLCPKIIDRNAGELDKEHQQVESTKKCITSGSLLNIKSWKQIHGFDEAMFIDGVDFEFCYRLKQRNEMIYRINQVKLIHEIGEIDIRHFLIFKVIVKNHSAFRKYYIARNIMYMARKRENVLLMLKGFLQELKLILIIALYEDDKKNKVCRVIKGIRDGCSISIER